MQAIQKSNSTDIWTHILFTHINNYIFYNLFRKLIGTGRLDFCANKLHNCHKLSHIGWQDVEL